MDLNNNHGVATKYHIVSGRFSSEGNMYTLCSHRASSSGRPGDMGGTKGQVALVYSEGSDGCKRTKPQPGDLGQHPGRRGSQAMT